MSNTTLLAASAPKKKGRVGRIILIILLLAVLAVLGWFGYRLWKSSQVPTYEAATPLGAAISNEAVELTIAKAEEITAINGFELESGYVYIGVVYSYKNITAEPIEWKKFPFIYIAQYEDTGSGYKIIKDTEQAFDLNALRYYGLSEGIDFSNSRTALPAGESRTSADIIKIPSAEYSAGTYFVSVDNIEAITAISAPISDATAQ